jgi:hypothetical protein
LTLASAGLKRMLAVAYLLVWAWEGHKAAAALLRQEPERSVTVLFDEPETHLHPQWQRRLLPALLDAVRGLDTNVSPQLLVSTHSPLILASAETLFDESSDRLLHFEPDEQGHARVEPITWAKRGTVTAWLTSPVFGLKQSRSLEEKSPSKPQSSSCGDSRRRTHLTCKHWSSWTLASGRSWRAATCSGRDGWRAPGHDSRASGA